jgi:hypothetical protein
MQSLSCASRNSLPVIELAVLPQCQMNQLHILTPAVFNIPFNVMLPPITMSLSLFNQLSNIQRKVQTLKYPEYLKYRVRQKHLMVFEI